MVRHSLSGARTPRSPEDVVLLPGARETIRRHNRHRLDPAQCVYVGREPTDRGFARTLGFTYQEAADVLGPASDPLQ